METPPGEVPLDGRGMSTPWLELQAEAGKTNATVLGPSRAKWDANHIEAEAIGRRALRLSNTGDYVSFTTSKAANSIVVRFAIPDAPGGGGINATLGVYVNGTRTKSLQLTSHFAWSYQGALLGTPDVDKPAAQPHTFFDEAHLMLDEIPVGAEVKLQKDSQDQAQYYVIDLIDFEEVAPPLSMPAGFTSVTSFGVQPDDGKDHGADIAHALASVSKLWFPKGSYLVKTVPMPSEGLENPGIEVRGAGMWYTVFNGRRAMFYCKGTNVRCVFGDFAVFGETIARDEETEGSQKAFAGPMGKNSLIENIWIEHEVAAIWPGADPPQQVTPTDGLLIRNCRMRNLQANGVNFANGTSNSTVSNSQVRNSGDEAFVVWPIKWTDWVNEMTYAHGNGFIAPESKNGADQGSGHGNTFSNLTSQMPWRGQCFGSYGGYDNTFKDSLCEDVLSYPGILVDNEFSPYPFGSGLTTFRNITLLRAGGAMYREETGDPWQHGALDFFMKEGSISDVLVENVDIVDPTYSGVEFRGYVPGVELGPNEKVAPNVLNDAANAKLSNVTLRNVKVTNAGTYGIQVSENGGRGSVTLQGVSVSGSVRGGIDKSNAPAPFFNLLDGNQGF